MAAVLVVRSFDSFSRILTENGFRVINCPTIETSESGNFRSRLAEISAKNYDGIFVTSQKAAEIVFGEIICKNFSYDGKVYVLGASSFERLREANLDLYFDENANTAREMLDGIPPENLLNKRFLFIRGARSLRTVPEFLEKIATVDEAIVYETRQIAVTQTLRREIVEKAAEGGILGACFFSPSGAESFLKQFDEKVLQRMKIAAIGKTTADFLAKRNLAADFISTRATAGDFASELAEYLKRNQNRASDENEV